MKSRPAELTAILIAPDRSLAEQFCSSLSETRAFQIVSEMKSYPPQQTLDIRLKQVRPDVVLLDLATDLDAASEIIRFISSSGQPVHVVGLHTRNDSDAIVRSLRLGATEFLSVPFDQQSQREAVARLTRLRQPDPEVESQPGNVTVFSSAKPGSGSSMLAAQTAFALKKVTGQRVLLADFDLMGGTIGFYLKLSHTHSLLDALQYAGQLNPQVWSSMAADCAGVDVLPAPDTPYAGAVDSARLHVVMEYLKSNYDWIIIDLPVVFHRLSLMSISEADRALLVSTSELPSLHLARKAVTLLEQLGFPRDRFQMLVNRMDKRDEIAGSDIDKLFNCSVHSKFPNDYFSLNRAVTLGQPVDSHSDLGKAIESMASRLSGRNPAAGRKGGGATAARVPVLQV